jgi:hypothetical protein
MTAKHQDPEYRMNARILRQQVQRMHRYGESVTCGRCGYDIQPEQQFDVGHIDPDGGHARSNLRPEHRYKSGICQGNRAHGGRLGQARQQARKTTTTRQSEKGLLKW